MYAGCQITWGSKLQTEIALSTTESKYIALSSAMREVIQFLGIMKETAGLFGLLTRDPVFRCTVWEDNESCITVAKSPMLTPQTKHIAIKYHHFRCFVSDRTIIIKSIDTAEQNADFFTKPLGEKSFCFLRHHIMGWWYYWDSNWIRRKYYAKNHLFFPCLLSLQFQGECENISNEFQI